MGYFDLKIDATLGTPLTSEVIKTILTNCERAQGIFYGSSVERGSGRFSLEQAMKNIEEDLRSFREDYVGSIKVYFTSHPDQLGAEISFNKGGDIVYYPREKYNESDHCRFTIAYEWHVKQLLLITEPYKISYLWAGDMESDGELFSKNELTITAIIDTPEASERKSSHIKRIALIEKIVNNGKSVGCLFQPYFLDPTATIDALYKSPLELLFNSPLGDFKLAFSISRLVLSRDSKERVNDLRPYARLLLALCKGFEIFQFEAERGVPRYVDLIGLIAALLFSPIGYIIMYCYSFVQAVVDYFDNIVAYFKKPINKRRH